MTYNARELGIPNLKMRNKISVIKSHLFDNNRAFGQVYAIIRKRECEIKDDYYHDENHFIDGVMEDFDTNPFLNDADKEDIKWVRRQLNLYKLLIMTE